MNIDNLDPADFKIEYQLGQRTGLLLRPETGIKITHIPTGICAVSNTDRSHHRNKL